MAVSVKMNKPRVIANRICDNEKLGIFVAETCAKYMNDYVPMQSGMLSQNYVTEPFKVIYTSVYAHRQFNGDGFNFSKEKHPLATAHWDNACSEAKKNQIANEITAYLKRG